MLSVILRFTDYDYHFGIFKLFFYEMYDSVVGIKGYINNKSLSHSNGNQKPVSSINRHGAWHMLVVFSLFLVFSIDITKAHHPHNNWNIVETNVGKYWRKLWGRTREHIAENYSFSVKQHSLAREFINCWCSWQRNDFVDLIGTANLSNLKAQFTRRMNPMAL